MSEVVLETRGLTKYYGRRRVVDSLDLRVEAGQIYGFLGPNGAGKSTTLRMILGLIRPTAGEVELMGHDTRRQRQQALRQVGAQVETPVFYGNLSARRNLQMLGAMTAPSEPRDIARVLEMVRLTGREQDKVKTFSQGMRMRLGLAQALLPRPRFLLLDEPTNGLDPQGMKEVRELIVELAHGESGMTVFLSSHLLGEIQQVCDRVAVINQGRLVAEGRVETLLHDEETVRLDIGCGDPARAAELLAAHPAVKSVEAAPPGLRAMIAADAAGAVNRALVEAGLDVWELSPRRMSLEEFFLRVTGGPT